MRKVYTFKLFDVFFMVFNKKAKFEKNSLFDFQTVNSSAVFLDWNSADLVLFTENWNQTPVNNVDVNLRTLSIYVLREYLLLLTQDSVFRPFCLQ